MSNSYSHPGKAEGLPILIIGSKWYSGPTGPESQWQVVLRREEIREPPEEPRRKDYFKSATVKQDAAASHAGRPRIGVRCTTPDKSSWSLFYRKERNDEQ
jgi:hypothetical protein